MRLKSVIREEEVLWVRFWNPATRLRSKKSPCLQTHPHPRTFLHMGFGYDNSSDTYKVVAVVGDGEYSPETAEVRVHCMGDNCWRKVVSWNGFPKLMTVQGCHGGHYVSGHLNWVAAVKSRADTRYLSFVICSFDLRNETCRYLLPLECLYTTLVMLDLYPDLGVLRGCLCLSHYYGYGKHFSFWQMKEFGVVESWISLLNISCLQLHLRDPSLRMSPLIMTENGDVIFTVMDRLHGLLVITYHYRDSSTEYVKILNQELWLNSTDYVQSLVFPYHN